MPGRPKQSNANADPYPPGWEPFLASIREDPDDDTRRLVFADWLQENGDEARAVFIRLQCAAARGDADAAAQADALLAANSHAGRWLRGFPAWVAKNPDRCTFCRGFIAAMAVTGRQWVADGSAIRRLTALEELRVEQAWNTVVKSRDLVGLRVLTLTSAGSALIESLAKSPVLPSLAELNVLAKSSDGVSLRSFRNLLGTKKLAGLRRLRIESVPFGAAIALGLWEKWFAGLEELRLRGVSLDASTGAWAIARTPAAGSLRVLDLSDNVMIRDNGLDYLLDSPGLRKLDELVLASCGLTAESAPAIADWEGLRTVRRLDLRDNRIRRPDAKVIRDSPHARNLTELLV